MCYNVSVNLTEVAKAVVPSFITVVLGIIVLRTQLKHNRKVQAEGTFFNLLNSIRNMVANTKGKITSVSKTTFGNKTNEDHSGVTYFSEANKELQARLSNGLSEAMVYGTFNMTGVKESKDIEVSHQMAKDIYNGFYKDHVPELAHYYRFTFNVLNFIDSNPDIPENKKIQYANFIQSQMSDSELQLLYYNGIGVYGKKYYDLMEKYNFLQNMDASGGKGFIEFLKNFYPKTKFRSLKSTGPEDE